MITVYRSTTIALIATLVVAFAVGGTAAATTRQVALGVSMTDSASMAVVDDFTASVGRAPAIWALWSDWGAADNAFPTAAVQGLHTRGIVPMINWEPINPSDQNDCSNWSLDNIISGHHDSYIRDWATAARDAGGRVIVRFAHEMNGYWYIWGLNRCTNTGTKFKAAWRHVVNIFRGPNGVGATNVRFLWSVFGTYKVWSVWPGRKYVDYMGFTAFNWAMPGHPSWRSMVKTMVPTMRAIQGLSKKPIIVAEMGAGYKPSCAYCDKVKYIAQGYPAVYAKWPRIVGMVYFNIDMSAISTTQPDWRLTSPPGAFDAYKLIVADERFQGAIP